MRYKICSLLLVIFSLVFLSPSAKAIFFASDYVYLYQSGVKIIDDTIYLASYKSWSDRCQAGLCTIGQQFYPVTIYLPKKERLLTSTEFMTLHPYVGPESGPAAGKAKNEWGAKNTDDYLRYLNENSQSNVAFDPGPSSGGEGCGYPNCLGGRVGDPRTFDLNLSNGTFSEHQLVPSTTNRGILDPLWQFITAVTSFLRNIISK